LIINTGSSSTYPGLNNRYEITHAYGQEHAKTLRAAKKKAMRIANHYNTAVSIIDNLGKNKTVRISAPK
jgi:RecA/RadA recombinase